MGSRYALQLLLSEKIMKLLMTQQPLKPGKIGTNFESIEFSTVNHLQGEISSLQGPR